MSCDGGRLTLHNDINEDMIDATARDWDSPIGQAIEDATQRVEDTARIMAPSAARAVPGWHRPGS
jgi:hypothetical protein